MFLKYSRELGKKAGQEESIVRFVQNSAAKLNLSLRVTSRRGDGYHDIVSLFLRLPSAETLLISEANAKIPFTSGALISKVKISWLVLCVLQERRGIRRPFLMWKF